MEEAGLLSYSQAVNLSGGQEGRLSACRRRGLIFNLHLKRVTGVKDDNTGWSLPHNVHILILSELGKHWLSTRRLRRRRGELIHEGAADQGFGTT